MFQRIKGALDRTIAEEQARQRAFSDKGSNASSSPSRRSTSVTRNAGGASPAKRVRPKKPGQSGGFSSQEANGDSILSPDPAVFEAAFVIDDSDDTTRVPSPMPRPKETENQADVKTAEEGTRDGGEAEKPSPPTNGEKAGDVADQSTSATSAPPPTELPPDIRAKLRKLDKLESTYPELLRSYRIAHSRATSIEPFERALRENTPLTSIKDPNALVEYLNQLNLKADMVMDELKRISAEKDDFKKKYEESSAEVTLLKDGTSLPPPAIKPDDDVAATEPKKSFDVHADDHKDGKADNGKHSRNVSASKSPVSSVLGIFSPKHKPQPAPEAKDEGESEDFFSYDDELPQLQAEVEAKNMEIAELKTRLDALGKDVSAAKENSAGLADALEKATRQLSESGETGTLQQASLQNELDATKSEITSLTERLEASQGRLRDLEGQLSEQKSKLTATVKEYESELAAATRRESEIAAKFREADANNAGMQEDKTKLSAELEELKQQKAVMEGTVAELEKQIQTNSTAAPAAASATLPAAGSEAGSTGQSASAKKKNRKKKKTGAAAAAETTGHDTAAGADTPEESTEAASTDVSTGAVDAIKAEIEQLSVEMADKDRQIKQLTERRKSEEDLREEIETLQENLVNIGQDHVDAKERIKALGAENSTLKERIAELAKELASSSASAITKAQDSSEFDKLKQELVELTVKSATLQSDCAAAQQLAQTRYKDLTDLREVLQKAQPELKTLRLDSAALKTTREELATRNAELAGLEKLEKELKGEATRAQRLAADREGEIKGLREKLAAETSARVRLEDEKRVAGRDLRRAEADKIELSAKEEKATRELQRAQGDMSKLRPRIAELEEQAHKLRAESERLHEESGLKSSQYGAAQDLLASMRDQTAEMGVRLKEAQAQAEGLEEELAETTKLLGERTREAETMRRLLADVDGRADTKVREMRDRLDAAMEERDRLEDESSTGARRRAREAEELRSRIRDLERENKSLTTERDDLEAQAKDWKHKRAELEAVEEKAGTEVTEMRGTVASLRTTLDASEAQVRDSERQRGELRRNLDEYRIRYDKLAKEQKALQARLAVGGPGPSGRSSMDSNRSGTPGLTNGGATSGGASGAPDVMYLKTILLQFLEQKDNKLRAQLVPVLGKLLRFDRADEQKWLAAVQHIGAR